MICWHLLGYLNVTYVEIIGLEAPGNYLDRFWCNQISVLLLEKPKPDISMISGSLDPSDPLFMDSNIPKILQGI